MMACGWGTLRFARFGNFICQRWHQHKPHRVLGSILNETRVNGFQYVTIMNNLSTFNGRPDRKAAQRVPKITLHLENDKVIVIDMDSAQKMAKRRMLHLAKVKDDPKAERAVYKLVSQQNVGDEVEDVANDGSNNHKKMEKVVWISRNIQRHDLDIKLKKIRTMLEKRSKCRIIKTFADEDDVNELTENIKNAVKEFGDIATVKTHKKVVTISIVPRQKDIKAEGDN